MGSYENCMHCYCNIYCADSSAAGPWFLFEIQNSAFFPPLIPNSTTQKRRVKNNYFSYLSLKPQNSLNLKFLIFLWGTVKGGNLVTFFALINFFLKNILRWPLIFSRRKITLNRCLDDGKTFLSPMPIP